MLWHLDMNFFSTEYFGMQVLVCKSSICNTNLFFVLPFSVNMQLTFLLSSVEEVWLLFYMFAFQMRDFGREKEREGVFLRDIETLRENWRVFIFVFCRYNISISFVNPQNLWEVCNKNLVVIFFILNRRMLLNVNKLLVVI